MPVQATSRDFWLRIGQSPLSCKQDYYNKVAARADYLKIYNFHTAFPARIRAKRLEKNRDMVYPIRVSV